MKSMTGFGMAEYVDEQTEISVEIKTINHRYKDFNIRISRKYILLEDLIRKYVSEIVNRGRIEIGVKIKTYQDETTSLQYNAEIAERYKGLLDQIHEHFPDINDDRSISSIARFPDVIYTEDQAVDIDQLWIKLQGVFDNALSMLDESRTQEGESLKDDFIVRCELVEKYCGEIEKISEEIPKKYYEQLCKNIESYTDGLIDEQRLCTEMAIYADRCNITEELVRLKSHLANFKTIIEADEPIGRKLDFLFQEINREANTIASKTNSFDVSTIVVEIKSELEKMREQIQNIE